MTARGARIYEAGDLLSHVRSAPGPTHSPFDLLAAAAAVLSPGPRLALLGFAGGGMLAPLRAMGFAGAVSAVDLSTAAHPLFERFARPWAGEVRFTRAEAGAWLRRTRRRFDCVVEDLSVAGVRGATKPPASMNAIPALLRRRLAPGGIAVVNLLPMDGVTWKRLLGAVASPFPARLVARFDEYENRLLLLADRLPSARRTGARLRDALGPIGSRIARRFSLRLIG